ncbi:hypothetical protein D9758_005809 [Tetrapyrgos nigripes]|uniref:Uncharacterized protein n=1 Tax=Tetrapyrgos nigripes TaxID=182062 RepID=A0A8H5GJU6_9AGAR|nr:hypothetical protein D9758_005809 [Tetrapyrgos nigripes]
MSPGDHQLSNLEKVNLTLSKLPRPTTRPNEYANFLNAPLLTSFEMSAVQPVNLLDYIRIPYERLTRLVLDNIFSTDPVLPNAILANSPNLKFVCLDLGEDDSLNETDYPIQRSRRLPAECPNLEDLEIRGSGMFGSGFILEGLTAPRLRTLKAKDYHGKSPSLAQFDVILEGFQRRSEAPLRLVHLCGIDNMNHIGLVPFLKLVGKSLRELLIVCSWDLDLAGLLQSMTYPWWDDQDFIEDGSDQEGDTDGEDNDDDGENENQRRVEENNERTRGDEVHEREDGEVDIQRKIDSDEKGEGEQASLPRALPDPRVDGEGRVDEDVVDNDVEQQTHSEENDKKTRSDKVSEEDERAEDGRVGDIKGVEESDELVRNAEVIQEEDACEREGGSAEPPRHDEQTHGEQANLPQAPPDSATRTSTTADGADGEGQKAEEVPEEDKYEAKFQNAEAIQLVPHLARLGIADVFESSEEADLICDVAESRGNYWPPSMSEWAQNQGKEGRKPSREEQLFKWSMRHRLRELKVLFFEETGYISARREKKIQTRNRDWELIRTQDLDEDKFDFETPEEELSVLDWDEHLKRVEADFA